MESRRRKRAPDLHTVLPADFASFAKDLAQRPVRSGWQLDDKSLVSADAADGEVAQGADSQTSGSRPPAGRLQERRDMLKQRKREQVEAAADEDQDVDEMLLRKLYDGTGERGSLEEERKDAEAELEDLDHPQESQEDEQSNSALRPFQSAFLMDVLPEIPEDARELETLMSEYTKRESHRQSLVSSMADGSSARLNSQAQETTEMSPRSGDELHSSPNQDHSGKSDSKLNSLSLVDLKSISELGQKLEQQHMRRRNTEKQKQQLS